MAHCSWHVETNGESLDETQVEFQNSIPVYDCHKKYNPNGIYERFFEESGALIIRNVFQPSTMNEYNSWCETMLVSAKHDLNFRHPKQKDKFVINDVIGRMASTNPNLLL